MIPELFRLEKISDVIESNLKNQLFVLSHSSQHVRKLKCEERERFASKILKIYQFLKNSSNGLNFRMNLSEFIGFPGNDIKH